MEHRVKQIMAEIIGIDMDSINDQTSPDTVPEWDSLKHMQLIVALEEEFSIEILDEYIDEMMNLDRIIGVLEELAK